MYVFSIETDFTGVAAGRGLEAHDTRGRDARGTVVFRTAKHIQMALLRMDFEQFVRYRDEWGILNERAVLLARKIGDCRSRPPGTGSVPTSQ